MNVADVARYLEDFAPLRLAEEWDNVGLLVGDGARPVRRIMTCLTISADVAAEAVCEQVDLIVVHHPLPFRALKRITSATPEGRLLLTLIGANIAVYSPHTAFDSAAQGINQRLAVGLGLTEIKPLVPESTTTTSSLATQINSSPGHLLGSGRCGNLPTAISLRELVTAAKSFLKIDQAQFVGVPDCSVRKVAVACGSAGEFLPIAVKENCDVLVTGETRFHTCLEAEAFGVGLILVGHYASERFGVEHLAADLARQFPALTVWPSLVERDPLKNE